MGGEGSDVMGLGVDLVHDPTFDPSTRGSIRVDTRTHFYVRDSGPSLSLHEQVAVADLAGMVIGIELARQAGTRPMYIWGAYLLLSVLDFVFILKVVSVGIC